MAGVQELLDLAARLAVRGDLPRPLVVERVTPLQTSVRRVMPLGFGILLMQERPVPELVGWGTRFDEAGVDSVWIAEHLALAQDVDHPWYAGWDLLEAMAVVTERCQIGPLVTTFQYHSSLAMARHVVMVDALSDGRRFRDQGVGRPRLGYRRHGGLVGDLEHARGRGPARPGRGQHWRALHER
jgi:hypothetical protein